jgi:hypothetical protein
MDKNELAKLEQLIQSAKSANSSSNSNDEWDDLFRIIHNPGWTTLPEALFVFNTVESIVAQTRQITALRNGLLAGARLVGKSQAAGA